MNSSEELDRLWSSIRALIDSSELKYKLGDYKGAIDDKRKARENMYSYKNKAVQRKFRMYIRQLNSFNSKFNLIKDYKKKIDAKKISEIIYKLEGESNSKYDIGDYKGAIRSLRRAEKYY